MSKSKATKGHHRIVLKLTSEQLDELLCQIESTMPGAPAGTRGIEKLNQATGRALAQLQQTLSRQYENEKSRRMDQHEYVSSLRMAPIYAQLLHHLPAPRRPWGCSSSPKVTAGLRRRLLEGLNSNGVHPVPTQLPALPSKSALDAERVAVKKLIQLSTERAGLLTRRADLAVKCLAARRRILTQKENRELEAIESRCSTVQSQLHAGIPIQGHGRVVRPA